MKRPHPRLRGWCALWLRDPGLALAICDALVASRPVPDRLIARLGVTTKGEIMEAWPRKTTGHGRPRDEHTPPQGEDAQAKKGPGSS